MSGYQRINFKDQNVERPKTYEVTNNSDGSITLIESFGNVEELGTPINQENMNHIEDGLEAVSFSKFDINNTYKKDELITNIEAGSLKIYMSLIDNNFGHNTNEADFWQEVKFSGGGSMAIGHIFSLCCAADYVPQGCLPTDGSEYSKAQFSGLWTNYLTGEKPKLNTCTFADYEQDLLTYGQCAKFAIDLEGETFRVPLIKDGAVIQQALTNDELGKSYNAGAPNITGDFAVNGSLTPNGAFTKEAEIGGYALVNSNPVNTRTGFDASLSNPIYSNSDTIQMNAVAMRYFVVVANGEINESLINWSEWATSLQGKANVDFANISNAAKVVINEYSSPDIANAIHVSSSPATNSTYTAPQDGWFYAFGVSASDGRSLLRLSVGENVFTTPIIDHNMIEDKGQLVAVNIPVCKGDTVLYVSINVTLTYGDYTNLGIWFVPKKGAQ